MNDQRSSHHGNEIERVIQLLARLPGLGPRSARRAALFLVQNRSKIMEPLAGALGDALENVTICSNCGNVDTRDPCAICSDARRDASTICVVEEVGDVWALERAVATKGHYHVLGGTLSALEGRGPEDLNISGLIARARADEVAEVIIAVNATVDGQTTAHYLTDQLVECSVIISRLAHGVPVGGELDYLDEGTLAAAMKARRPF
ncbi:MAG: recombination mediator RecR [Hyphomicrobiales bacterium]